jgi:hypothetical protein
MASVQLINLFMIFFNLPILFSELEIETWGWIKLPWKKLGVIACKLPHGLFYYLQGSFSTHIHDS